MDMADLSDINNQVKELEHKQIQNLCKCFNGIPIIMDYKLTGTNMYILVSPLLYNKVMKERSSHGRRNKENPASG